ncbi:uncharacterized protein F54H12.2 [Trichonephila clavipes]|nr:uncharacterized protein F54H12.2 [Trichonephila clavipes]
MDLEKVYQEPEHSGSFGGVETLFKATDGKFSRKDIKKWLSAKDSYTLHKPIKKKIKKNRVLGQSFQKGYGIGGWFKRLFRTALPFLTRGAKSVGKEVLKTGTQIVNDLLEGQNLEDTAKHRAKETRRKLAREAIKKADDMLGQGKKYKRKKRFSKHIIPSKVRKAKGRDIFGT